MAAVDHLLYHYPASGFICISTHFGGYVMFAWSEKCKAKNVVLIMTAYLEVTVCAQSPACIIVP